MDLKMPVADSKREPKDTSEMSLTEFKKMLHETMQHTLLNQYHAYLESVEMSNDPEVKRKCVAMHIQTIGAEHKEKADPNANLPVFQFNFTSTGMTATQLPMVEQVDDQKPSTLPTLDFAHLDRKPVAPVDEWTTDDLMAPWED